MSQSGNELLAALHDLRQSITTEAAKRIARWLGDIELPSFAASADNLAHYLAFRHHDLRDLQLELMRYGLSSLGRLESRVLITLQTVETALSALLSGKPTGKDWPPSSEQFFHGEAQLQANTRVLLGGTADHSGGRILVTLSGEAAQDPRYMLEIARRGADVVRINCAHDTADTWAAMIENTRKAGDAVGRRIPVLMDIAGPKFRIGNVKRQAGERLVAGDRFRMVADAAMFGSDAAIEAVCEPGDVLDHLAVGTEVVFDDGKLAAVVEESGQGSVLVGVTQTQRKGFKMKPERGLTFPRADLHLDPLTAVDLADLDFVATHADLIGYSFVQSADDITRLQDELAKRRPDWRRLGIIAKIETAQAVRNLPDIIVRAAGRQPFGVMIARGDLAVAIGFERLAEMQEEILWLCESAHVPVIWATQVLEEMVKSGLPTRGEMTDAAMAGRAECVMLNKGPNVGEAITALRGLLGRMMEHQSKKTARLRALRSW
ncbi:MAG TPA: pyruvate kinase [Acetobacteraceae bacterium]|nr:pyruvate kinase [Acetobacteraceae bacterium]